MITSFECIFLTKITNLEYQFHTLLDTHVSAEEITFIIMQ